MNTPEAQLLPVLAGVANYPGPEFHQQLKTCLDQLRESIPEAADDLAPFADYATRHSVSDLEELYTHTFDMNPTCALEVGWHLYGENYERGSFLVKIRQEMIRLGIPENGELPDHLRNLLLLLAQIEGVAAPQYASTYILPALGKMLQSMAGKENPYECVLKTIQRVLRYCFESQAAGVKS